MEVFGTHLTRGEEGTRALGHALMGLLKAGDTVALFGELGAGKTAFVKGMAQRLGVADAVSSPTFTIMKIYYTDPPVYHFDMYRISSERDLISTGFFDYIGDDGIAAVEWSENIVSSLPREYIRVEISYTGNQDERKIVIENIESRL